MADVKMIVMYPPAADVGKFESIYHNEDVPMEVAKLAGKTKVVATRRSTAGNTALIATLRLGLRDPNFEIELHFRLMHLDDLTVNRLAGYCHRIFMPSCRQDMRCRISCCCCCGNACSGADGMIT